MPGSSLTAHSTDITRQPRQRITRQKLDKARQLLDSSTDLDAQAHGVSLDKPRQARQARPRQQLDGASTARQLDSQGSTRARARVTWGFLSFLGVVSYRIRILMYFDVSCMYLACISMCPIKIHQDTSRYIEIQQDTFVSVTLAIKENVSYLGICILLYDTFRIHLRYIVS
jgi:hypothetical protein